MDPQLMSPSLKKTNSNMSASPQDHIKLINEVRKAIEKHASIDKIKQKFGDEYLQFLSDQQKSFYIACLCRQVWLANQSQLPIFLSCLVSSIDWIKVPNITGFHFIVTL